MRYVNSSPRTCQQCRSYRRQTAIMSTSERRLRRRAIKSSHSTKRNMPLSKREAKVAMYWRRVLRPSVTQQRGHICLSTATYATFRCSPWTSWKHYSRLDGRLTHSYQRSKRLRNLRATIGMIGQV